MKAVALTIEVLALLNNEERKKEEVQNGTLANFSLQAFPYGSVLQKGTASHKNA